jgi:hypothetical protein
MISSGSIPGINHNLQELERCERLPSSLKSCGNNRYSLKEGMHAALRSRVSHYPLARGGIYGDQPCLSAIIVGSGITGV